MGDVLVFAESKKGEIHPVTYELLGIGRKLANQLGTDLCALLLSKKEIDPRELIYRGADKVFFRENDKFGIPNEMVFKEAAVKLVEEEAPDIFLIGATHFGRSLGPRIAMALDTGLTADCTGLEIDKEGNLVPIRPAFSGNILAHIRTKSKPQMATVRYKEMVEADRNPTRKGVIIKKEFNLPGNETGI